MWNRIQHQKKARQYKEKVKMKNKIRVALFVINRKQMLHLKEDKDKKTTSTSLDSNLSWHFQRDEVTDSRILVKDIKNDGI